MKLLLKTKNDLIASKKKLAPADSHKFEHTIDKYGTEKLPGATADRVKEILFSLDPDK